MHGYFLGSHASHAESLYFYVTVSSVSGAVGPDELFFGGAPFTHHVHNAHQPNRDAKTPNTWAAEMLRRHVELSREKQC